MEDMIFETVLNDDVTASDVDNWIFIQRASTGLVENHFEFFPNGRHFSANF